MPSVSQQAKSEPRAGSAKRASTKREGYREMVESIVVAFVLAFLFRTFEAEAFVIPTGSMAPTLMGQHKDVTCPQCGFFFTVSASEEAEPAGQVVRWATCPNCRFSTPVDDQEPPPKGDRILVLKFPYTLRDPQRFDVVVFRFPEDPKVNYIKRLAGLPGEEIRIEGGDLYVRPLGSNDATPWQIVRKPPDKQRVLAMTVYNNDYQSPLPTQAGWPARWQAEVPKSWVSLDGKEFQLPDASPEFSWLRYHHLPPPPHTQAEQLSEPEPQKIRDCYGYNLGSHTDRPPTPALDGLGEYWVGDLLLEFEVSVQQPTGELACELIEGNRQYQAVFELATGRVVLRLREGGPWQTLATATTGVVGTGDHEIAFANCDDSLRLWIDGSVVLLDPSGAGAGDVTTDFVAYPPPATDEPTPQDTAPAAIGTRDAKLSVRHLVLKRDIYYATGNGHRASTFPIEPGNYFVLGDNNPKSKDSRLWTKTHTVAEHLMIGEAFFIYWPHGVAPSWAIRIPLGRFGEVELPFRPHVERMHLIR